MKLLEDVRVSVDAYFQIAARNEWPLGKAHCTELAAIERAEDCVRYSWLAINKSVYRFDWEVGVVDVYDGLPVFTPEQRVEIDKMMKGKGDE